MAIYKYTGNAAYDQTHNTTNLSKNWDTGVDVLNTMATWLGAGNYLMVSAVLNTVTSEMEDHEPKDVAGAKYVRHWVTIRSIYGDDVVIVNPFRNRIESYSWSKVFKGSMNRNHNSVVRIIPK
jgi:hypothetical protein